MPESPEVDALAAELRERLTGRTVTATDVAEFRALKTRARPLEQLVGARIDDVRRFGKHVSLDSSGADLVVSFGRAGWARWAHEPTPESGPGAGPEIARLTFDDGAELAFVDGGAWLSLGLSVVDDPNEVAAIAKLGPDPSAEGFTIAQFAAVLGTRRKQLKALLQEQESLAGIGNAYSDEILHVARLSPHAHAASLDDDERARLFAATRDVLRGAMAARRGVPLAEQKAHKVASMRVHGRAGEACPVCGDPVRDIPGSKAGAQYCPTCQTRGVPLPE